MRRFTLFALAILITALCSNPLVADDAHNPVSAQQAFDQLKTLAGTWHGTPEGVGAAEIEAKEVPKVVHEFRVSANGTVVMEIMGPDSPYEMINMYHVDGDDLVLAHYCAGGNQPTMRLDLETSTAEKLVFDFAGGTNFDPKTDTHIHSAELQLEEGKLKSSWTSYMNGEEAGGMIFHLARAEAAEGPGNTEDAGE